MGKDDFITINFQGDARAVGGTWRGEGGATCDFTVATHRKGRFTNPIAIAEEFEESMNRVKAAVKTTPEEIDELQRKVVNMAIDNQVLEIWRRNRIAAGRTDHKKLLKQESLPRGLERLARSVRRSGYEIGWLRGVRWSFPWWSPPSCVPYDWAVDGLPHPAKTGIVNVVIKGHFGAGLWKCKAPGCLASAIGNDHCKIHQGR